MTTRNSCRSSPDHSDSPQRLRDVEARRLAKRRAVTALLLPLLVVFLGGTKFFQDVCYAIFSTDAMVWAGVLAAGSIITWEIVCVADFFRLVLVRGDTSKLFTQPEDPARAGRLRERRFRLIAVAGSALTTLLVIEVAFRVLNVQPALALFPNSSDVTGVDNTLNALGIREDWDALADDDPRTRIAFLGDSFTYGDSVEPYEAFCHLIEGMLADWGTDGAVTINLGVPGTAPPAQYGTWLKYRDVLRPAVLVHVIYLNDLDFSLHHVVLNIHGIAKAESWMGRQSYLWRYAEKQFRYWRAWHDTLDYFRGGLDPEQREQSWKVFESAVRDCKRAAEERDVVYCMVLFPWLFQLQDYPLADVHVRMRDFADRLDVPYLDLLEVFEGRDSKPLCVNPVNEHPSPTAHGIAAERIAEFLRSEVLPGLSTEGHPPP